MQMRLRNAYGVCTINQSGVTGALVIFVLALATPVVSRNPTCVHVSACRFTVSRPRYRIRLAPHSAWLGANGKYSIQHWRRRLIGTCNCKEIYKYFLFYFGDNILYFHLVKGVVHHTVKIPTCEPIPPRLLQRKLIILHIYHSAILKLSWQIQYLLSLKSL